MMWLAKSPVKSRVQSIALIVLGAFAQYAIADVAPETIGTTTMADPQESWVFVHDGAGPIYIIDAASGDMHGLLSSTSYTPSVAVHLKRGEIYSAERYYARKYRGARTDVVTIYNFDDLAAVAEIKIPDKIASLGFPQYISLMDNQRHLAVFNMTPAQSVSIVDIRDRSFVGEISTPGCALIMPTGDRGFTQICGDGTLQLIRLDRNGAENGRSRSVVFFDIDEDPVYDKPVATADGWLFVSFEGKVFEATVDDDQISISQPWSVLQEDDVEEQWRPGGGQLLAYYAELDLIFLLMHQGGVDTHEEPGTEIWVLDRVSQRRIHRIALEQAGTNIHVSKGDDPLLSVIGIDRQLHVFDVHTSKLLRSVAGIGVSPGLIQGFH
jgi:methylamine dehydrogenase heavy chain